MHHLLTFGEMGVVRDVSTGKEKLQDRGNTCMCVGYATQHAGNVYRILNLETGRLRLSRDVQWLGLMYKTYKSAKKLDDVDADDDADEDSSSSFVNVEEGQDIDDGHDDVSISETKADALPEEGWHMVKTGRETIHYEARPTSQTRSGLSYKTSSKIYRHQLMKFSTDNLPSPSPIKKPVVFESSQNGKFQR
jgi:hypothetical protein